MAAVATDDSDDTKAITSYRLRYTGAEDFDGYYTRLTAEIRSNPEADDLLEGDLPNPILHLPDYMAEGDEDTPAALDRAYGDDDLPTEEQTNKDPIGACRTFLRRVTAQSAHDACLTVLLDTQRAIQLSRASVKP